ncbi:hypothetical protein [Mycobacterium kubicae]|nr:hypothetical protein [Mycobacterium kubicae]
MHRFLGCLAAMVVVAGVTAVRVQGRGPAQTLTVGQLSTLVVNPY